MGVPKFFRYMSERYPCLSELVKDYQIPEFDHLYLDMNGVIHVCSHPNDNDPHFRITEEQIFASIFHYIEILFSMIKPRKLFFMAVDGVAPRAKMNQQRGRRFRSAKEAEENEKKVLARGEKLPDSKRFDSNCITPGTVFMDQLHHQLKYFVTNKVTNDPLWQCCKVILSGHETPGEGEHKIMDYIRYLKTLPDYDPNTRHCLYGLDADLIMLGLCCHEPHFSLLREEVKYGKQENKRITSPEETKFYLLHLSLMREYLDLEFQALKKSLPFEYNLENIIDDWVLMGFLVGNDFIPHLPDLHINKGALPILYNTYIEVLPTLNGYLNENGYLNLARFEKYMEKLAEFDMDTFEENYVNLVAFEEKIGRKFNSGKPQKPAESSHKSELEEMIKATKEMLKISDDDSDVTEDENDTFLDEFCQHKKDYYTNKLDYTKVTDEVLRDQAEGYIRALQWNLHYYYHGCQSWSWYYPHHYSPFISDITNFKDLKLDFDMGRPFLPFEQLLAVLPAASKNLLPAAYRELMTSPNSPIIEYYPEDFETDLNGKQQDWEAVVLIPLIDEKRLLEAMKSCNDRLTDEERRRNKHGPMNIFTYTNEDLGKYNAPGYFPNLVSNHALMVEVWREEIEVDISRLRYGLRPGVLLDVYYPGFPTLKHIPHTGALKKAKIKVFQHASRENTMILTIKEREYSPIEKLADEFLGSTIYINWPHMVEAKVAALASSEIRYNYVNDDGGERVEYEKLDDYKRQQFLGSVQVLRNYYYEKLGVDIGDTKYVVYASAMEGRKYMFGSIGKITYEKIWCKNLQPYALQTTVKDIAVYSPHIKPYYNVHDAFPVGSTVFMLGHPFYGSKGVVLESTETLKQGRLKVAMETITEPVVNEDVLKTRPRVSYMPGNTASQRVGITSHMLSRITGSILIDMSSRENAAAESTPKMNIGLNLKFNKKNEEVPGYTKKDNGLWLYSSKAVDLCAEYVEKFPRVIEHLSRNAKSDYFFRQDIFPDPNGVDELKKMVTWLKEQDFNAVERTECGTEVLDSEIVKEIENIVDNFEKKKSVRTMQVKPHLLYKNDLVYGNLPPVPTAVHRLFDRVVSVRCSYTVPLGLRGYIIGIHKAPTAADYMYDVLYDQPFPGGMTLNSSPNRAYRTSWVSFVNVTDGERRFQAKSNNKTAIASASLPYQQCKNSSLGNSHRPSSAFAQFNQSPPKPLYEDKDEKLQIMWSNMQTGTKPPHDETNLLKQILKIPEKPEIEEPVKTFFENITKKPSPAVKTNRSETPDSVKAFFKSSPRKPEKSYYMQLMAYFQKANLGQPRFKFLDVGSKVMAQVRFPDERLYSGLPCDDKESACESACFQALGHLGEIPLDNVALVEKEKARNEKIMESQNKLESALLNKKPKANEKELEDEKPKKTSTNDRSDRHHKSQFPNHRHRDYADIIPTPPIQWFGPKDGITIPRHPLPHQYQQQHSFYRNHQRPEYSQVMNDSCKLSQAFATAMKLPNEQLYRKGDQLNRQQAYRSKQETYDYFRSQNRRIDGMFERGRSQVYQNDGRAQNDYYRGSKRNDSSNHRHVQSDVFNRKPRQRNENGESGRGRDDADSRNSMPETVQNFFTSQDTARSLPSTKAEFVPLQAITRTRILGTIPVKTNTETKETAQNTTSRPCEKSNKVPQQEEITVTAKPKRKTRIAANFDHALDPNLC